jgi:hypothetical protein
MDLNVKRARLHNGWLLISGYRVGTMAGRPEAATTEVLVRCERVERWAFHRASRTITIYQGGPAPALWLRFPTPPATFRPVGAATEEADKLAADVDDLLWQGCAGISGSPLRFEERRTTPHEFEDNGAGGCEFCHASSDAPQHLQGGDDG